MYLPLQITFRHMDHSDAMEAMIREKAERLDRFAGDIMSCRVVIEPAGKHRTHGNQYAVRIDATVAGHEIAVTRSPEENPETRSLDVAVRDAFDAVRRQLEDVVRRRRLDVKSHEVQPHGRVSQIFSTADYGFIKAADGRDIYFHRNSVLDDGFERLDVGAEVIYAEEAGEKGPQASTVRLAGKHGGV